MPRIFLGSANTNTHAPRTRTGAHEIVTEMGIQRWPGGWSRASGLIHQPMVEGEHPAAVLAVLSRPGLEDFFACESGASDQNPCS